MSTYDPHSRRIRLSPGATLYAREHEEAHARQHQRRTFAWRLQERTARIPYVCRLARLWVEIEAARMALRTMERRGERTLAADREARRGIFSYVKALFWD